LNQANQAGSRKTPLAQTEQTRLNESLPKKKALRHENKIEFFGEPAARLTDAGESPAGSSHYQELIRLCHLACAVRNRLEDLRRSSGRGAAAWTGLSEAYGKAVGGIHWFTYTPGTRTLVCCLGVAILAFASFFSASKRKSELKRKERFLIRQMIPDYSLAEMTKSIS
jgi:hypothetical protein